MTLTGSLSSASEMFHSLHHFLLEFELNFLACRIFVAQTAPTARRKIRDDLVLPQAIPQNLVKSPQIFANFVKNCSTEAHDAFNINIVLN